MNADPRRIQIIRQHKRWCDKYLMFSIVAILGIFASAVLVLDYLQVPATARSGVYFLLSSIILAGVIWNATGLAVIEIHTLLDARKAG
jgi:hypothetical protein